MKVLLSNTVSVDNANVDKGSISNSVVNYIRNLKTDDTSDKPAISYILPNNKNNWLYYNPIAYKFIQQRIKGIT